VIASIIVGALLGYAFWRLGRAAVRGFREMRDNNRAAAEGFREAIKGYRDLMGKK